MKLNRKFILKYFLPLFLYILFIIFMSSQRNIETNTVVPDNVLKTAAHFMEYFILTILLYRFLGQITVRKVLWTVLIVVLFAISDELHQYFVPTRTASIIDLLVDYTGMITGLIVYRRFSKP